MLVNSSWYLNRDIWLKYDVLKPLLMWINITGQEQMKSDDGSQQDVLNMPPKAPLLDIRDK